MSDNLLAEPDSASTWTVTDDTCGSGVSFDKGGEMITFSYEDCSLEWTVDLRASLYPLSAAVLARALQPQTQPHPNPNPKTNPKTKRQH